MRRKKTARVNHRTTPTGYLKSEHWKQMGLKFWREDEVCEFCGVKHYRFKKDGTRVANRVFVWHHIRYTHLYAEPREDLMRLCKKCHDMCHWIIKAQYETEVFEELKKIVLTKFEYEPTKKETKK